MAEFDPTLKEDTQYDTWNRAEILTKSKALDIGF
jgi:hypothetical protein